MMLEGIEKRFCWAGLGIILFFLLPLFLGRPGIFSGEAAVLSYPQQVYLSRSFQGGHFPWWDGAVGAGAVDWSLRFSQGSCYPLNWPFLLLARRSAFGDYLLLYQIPLAAHLLLTGALAYLLARRGFRLGPAASLLLALSWSLSPVFALQTGRLPAVFSLSWLPAVLLCLARFTGGGSRRWLIAGGLSAALAGLGGDLASAAQVFIAAAVFGLASGLVALGRRDRPAAVRALAGVAAVCFLGACLAGMRWSGLLAVRLAAEGGVNLPPPLRPGPATLAGFLLPGLFGAGEGLRLWGPALSLGSSWPSAALPGGVASALLIAAGLLSLRRRRAGGWAAVALFSFLAGVLLSRFAPIRVLTASPSVLLAFSWSLLLGVSFQALHDSSEAVSPSRIGKILIAFAAVILIALLWPYRGSLGVVFPGFRGLHARAVSGFILALLAGLFAAAAGFVSARFLPPARRSGVFYLLALLEIAILSSRGFYLSASPGFSPGDLFARRQSGPGSHPAYRAAAAFVAAFPDRDNLFRRGYFRSAFDNLSWAFASASPLGLDLSPLSRRAATAFSAACASRPGEFIPRDWASNFWRNMSVHYLLTEKPLGPPGRPIPSGEGNYYAGALPNPLPRWYFQDRWVVADEERERLALLTFDLRAAGYCPREVWHVRPFAHLYPHPPPLSDAEWTKHFADLQEKNRVLSVDGSSPNRLTFSLDVKKLSMLVVTDLHHPGWKARVEDRGEEVHRVNYLQRGVWCRPGRCRVTMEFIPPSLGPGLALTAIGLIGAILILALPKRNGSAKALTANGRE